MKRTDRVGSTRKFQSKNGHANRLVRILRFDPTQSHQLFIGYAERISQRALIVIVSDLFVRPAELNKCFQHLRFRKHDVAVFHLLDKTEVDFEFDRPIRFLDLEGNSHILADPPLIVDEYRRSLETYLSDLKDVVSEAAVDYHRVSLDEPYDQVLARFLLGRN